MTKPISIVVTGGPCAGKTTCLTKCVETFSNRGWKVLLVPETATQLIQSGIIPWDMALRDFQTLVFKQSLATESVYLEAAEIALKQGKKVLVLCDRGLLDGAAYMSSFEEFQALVKSLGKGMAEICEQRYEGVIHLQTAAIGAPEFYTLANNVARKESPEAARTLDGKTLDAWRRHPHHRVIDNSTDFAGKVLRFEQAVASIIGDPVPTEIERKFLVQLPASLPVKFVESRITQHYLNPLKSDEVRRVRQRICGGETTYTYTEKVRVAAGSNLERESIIDERAYVQLLEEKIAGLNPVRKTRKCFFWSNRFFELDHFDQPVGECMLEIELANLDEKFDWPPFIEQIREVTDDPNYSNRKIAERF